jgi:hypothetical protein
LSDGHAGHVIDHGRDIDVIEDKAFEVGSGHGHAGDESL